MRREPDFGKIAAGLAREGMDSRHWVSYATVATVGGDGGIDYTDPQAIVVSPAGVDVDVILEPSGAPCTCRYGTGGLVSDLSPIRPGDQVVVGIPDGHVSMIPQVLVVISGASSPLPVEENQKPVFRNDRRSIFARGVPVEIRTDGGNRILARPDGAVEAGNGNGQVRVDQDGTVRLHGAGASESYVLGDTFMDALTKVMAAGPPLGPDTGLLGAFTALTAAAVGPLAAFQPGFQTAVAALTAFNARLPTFLSAKVKAE